MTASTFTPPSNDWDALEAEVLEVLALPGIQSPAYVGNHPYFWLAGGFVRADRGDEPGAQEYWRQGYQATAVSFYRGPTPRTRR
jgi:hypothetical protein